MKKRNYLVNLLVLLLLISGVTYSQDLDIVPYLKQIEAGNKQSVIDKLPELKKAHHKDPSLMFLEGVVTENAQDAVAIYKTIYTEYPNSKYADAALYRIYTYYYSLGLYSTSKDYLTKLKHNYPDSPYLSIAEKNIPDKDEDTTEQVDDMVKEKVETQPKTEETAATIPKDYKYTIQAGAFSNLSNAESLKKNFEDSGYTSEIDNKVVGGTTFHVVYVGKFADDESAQSFLQVLNSQYKLQGRIVSLNGK